MKIKVGLFILALSLMGQLLNAQEETPKEQKNILGGTFFFNAAKNGQTGSTLVITPNGPITIFGEEITTVNFLINPYYARQIGRGWMLGVQGGYGILTVRGNENFVFGPNRQENETWKLGFFGRYSFFPENKFSLFLQPGINYSRQTFRSFSSFTEFENDATTGVEMVAVTGASLKLGYNFQLIANFGRIGAEFGNNKDQNSGRTTQFNSFFTDFSFSTFALGAEMRF
ncbi:MAG: hypothetical protein KDC24_00650 [Saprospiraceae bacterium]|nr:hypothetical protein [Saprospiraceae bacterium]